MDASALPRPVGFVFGGGGSLGATQVGMVQALSERGVFPDLVAGTSVGALNGAVVALDAAGAAGRLAHAWARITRRMVFPGGVLGQVRTLQRTRTHLFPNTGLEAVITEILGSSTTFEQLRLPFAAVAMDVATGGPRVLSQGPLVPALLASAAIPGIFPPVTFAGSQLYDGGVVANVPVRQALAMGAKSLVVLDATFPGRLPSPPQTLAETLLFTAVITMRVQTVLEAPIAAETVPVVYLPGPDVMYVSPLEFNRTPMLIAGGHEAAALFLDSLQINGPGLYGSPSVPDLSPQPAPHPSL